MPKILFISNISKKVNTFSIASIKAAKQMGLEYFYGANWDNASEGQIESDEKQYDIKIVNIPLNRSPFSLANYKAYKYLIQYIKDNRIDYIHCNTPVGGLLGRLAGAKSGVKKIIYQAHGFHFYKGAPLTHWLLYYPIEKWLAHKTDALITINKEDYKRATAKFKLKNQGTVYYVPGVGIDYTQYIHDDVARQSKRVELGLNEDDIALISMGDLIARKNYPVAIKAVAKIGNPKVKYFICGKGPDELKLKALVKDLSLEKQVFFLGFRSDIKELLNACDIFVLTSKQEGLARSLMEGMAAGLPCVASKIRGNTDILDEGKGGYLVDVEDVIGYSEAFNELVENTEKIKSFGQWNMEKIKDYSIDSISNYIYEIYHTELINEEM